MKKMYVAISIVVLFLLALFIMRPSSAVQPSRLQWGFTSIDTMKYSRDLSREKLTDPLFDRTIDQQMQEIAATGAKYVAIATPYDDEFSPILNRWVQSARAHNLHVWFRGNWAGWEGWFGYQKISRSEHIQKTNDFILNHAALFQDGDVFSACPECENGGPGDPRQTGDITGSRQFLIDEYRVTKQAFQDIHKNVRSNFDSMNEDVAKVLMDKETTKALDGVVTIDHYVRDPDQMVADIKALSKASGGSIIIGEFGAPIPDIHGNMTEKEQATWIADTFAKLAETPEVIGVNYWTNNGGSTSLWSVNNTPHMAVASITKAYTSQKTLGLVKDETDKPLSGVKIVSANSLLYTDTHGQVVFPYIDKSQSFMLIKDGYRTKSVTISNGFDITTIVLEKIHESLLFKLIKLLHSIHASL